MRRGPPGDDTQVMIPRGLIRAERRVLMSAERWAAGALYELSRHMCAADVAEYEHVKQNPEGRKTWNQNPDNQIKESESRYN